MRVIELERVRFTYPGPEMDGDGVKVVLDGVSFGIEARSFVVVKGPSGAGKSTFLRLLCRLEEPDTGKLFYRGEPYDKIPAPHLRCRISFVPQMPALTPDTVRDNLLIPFSFQVNRTKSRPSDGILKAWLADVCLDGISLDQPATNLSVGQKQRLCLIRAALLEPDVLLLDEPVAALDDDSAAIVMQQTQQMNQSKGTTIIMATHTREPERVAPVTLSLRNGTIEVISP